MTRRTLQFGRCAPTFIVALGFAIAFVLAPVAAAPLQKRPTALAEIAALNGAMPPSMDIYPSDPCAGTWEVQLPSGEAVMKITVFRYRDLPLMHVSGVGFEPSNHALTRVDPHSIRAASGVGIALRCANDRAVAELKTAGRDQPLVLSARPGTPDLPEASAANARTALVREQKGDIVYVDAQGTPHQITKDGNYSDPALSPDGHTIAFIHLDGKVTTEGESGFTSLWVADALSGATRQLFASRPNKEPSANLASFQHPRFSLEGGFIYIDADAWATSAAVHQISVATGSERFVIDGSVNAIIRTGKYRGYLLVSRHKYHPAPQYGSYDPVYVVRPDAKETFMVPGSDKDDGEHSQAAWLQSNGLTAW